MFQSNTGEPASERTGSSGTAPVLVDDTRNQEHKGAEAQQVHEMSRLERRIDSRQAEPIQRQHCKGSREEQE